MFTVSETFLMLCKNLHLCSRNSNIANYITTNTNNLFKTIHNWMFLTYLEVWKKTTCSKISNTSSSWTGRCHCLRLGLAWRRVQLVLGSGEAGEPKATGEGGELDSWRYMTYIQTEKHLHDNGGCILGRRNIKLWHKSFMLCIYPFLGLMIENYTGIDPRWFWLRSFFLGDAKWDTVLMMLSLLQPQQSPLKRYQSWLQHLPSHNPRPKVRDSTLENTHPNDTYPDDTLAQEFATLVLDIEK